MKINSLKTGITFFACLMALSSFAQTDAGWLQNTMFASGKINVVVGVVSLIFVLIIVYLISIDRKLKKMEESNSNNSKDIQ